MISPQNLKVVILFTLFVATFLCTMLPLGLRAFIQREHNRLRKRNLKNAISLLNCFTAGVFLGTCLLDLLPEVREAVSDVLKQYHIRSEFPLTEVVVLFGFLILLTIEQFVTRWKAAHEHTVPYLDHQISIDSRRSAPTLNSYGSIDSVSSIPSSPGPIERTPLPAEAETNPLLEDENENENEESREPAPDPSRHSVIRPLMLLAALSLHSIFEGLAIGLQKTVDNTLQIFVALTLHKCIVAFSIGLNNVQSCFPLRIIFGLDVFFSLMSPIGIALGIGIEKISNSAIGVVTAVLQGLACGTFLYVVFMEILPHEFMARRNRPDRLLKVLCCLVGIAVVIGIVVIDPGD